jgi:hypothetical protein
MMFLAVGFGILCLPAAIYYLVGLWWLATARRKPLRAIVWAVSFVSMFAYTFQEYAQLKSQVENRGQAFRESVALASAPADVSALLIYREGPYSQLTGNGQECAVVCVKTLLDGRFKEFIIGFKDPMLFRHSADDQSKNEPQPDRDPHYYKVYTLVEQAGCKTETDIGMVGIAKQLQAAGRCFREIRRNHLEGRYFELTTDNDTPDAPPWKITANHVRLWDNGKSQDIARIEHAEVDVAYWFPLPGLFPHGSRNGLPTDFHPDFFRIHLSYGPFSNPIKTLQTVLGLPLDKDVHVPTATVPASPEVASAPSFNCIRPWQSEKKIVPRSEGPLKLARSYCFEANTPGMAVLSDPIVSPDGRAIAYVTSPSALRIMTIESGQSADYPVSTQPTQVAPAAITWDSSSTFVWAGSQEMLWDIKPVATAESGAVRTMPPLGARATALFWARDGLAVANLDNKAFAIIDVEHGTIKDTLPLAEMKALGFNLARYSLDNKASAARLPDGRLRVLFRENQWLVWTQGEKPRVLPDPYPNDKKVWLVMSPDGSRVLVARQLTDLRPDICPSRQSERCGSSPVPNAVLAALHDLDTGKAIWTMLERTKKTDLEFPRPVISPDGRFALIAFPAGDVAGAAVVGMDDGRVRQELPGGGINFTFGYASEGRTAWTYGTGVIALYDVAEGYP